MRIADMPADQEQLVQKAHDDQHVIVNGEVLMENGEPIGSYPGRAPQPRFNHLDRRATSRSVCNLASPERESTCFRELGLSWPLARFYPGGDVQCAWC